MALLTADDVLNKAFSKTKYREGFDQDEVDDFLDEVAATIAQLTAERDDLSARLQAAEAGAAAAPEAPAAPAAPVEAPPLTAAGGIPGTSGLLAAATDPNPPSPTGMLAMAQKLHDEYVHAGEAERERIVTEANADADKIRERAEVDAQARMDELTAERSTLEARIDDLRRFERDYRARLRAYLENLLGDLEHSGAGGPVPAAPFVSELPGEGAHDGSDTPPSAPWGDAAADSGVVVVDEVTVVEEVSDDGEVEIVEVSEEVSVFGFGGEGFNADSGAGEAAGADAGADGAWPAAGGAGGDGGAQDDVPDAWTGVDRSDAASVGGATPAEPVAPAAPAAPSYDASQPWESQLSAGSPFAPVSGGASAAPAAEQPATPVLDDTEAPAAPTRPSVFDDIIKDRRPEGDAN